ESAVYACLNRVSRMWFPRHVRTTQQGAVAILAGRLGALSSGVVFAALLVDWWKFDWRTAIGILVGVGAVHWLLFTAIFRNSPRQHRNVNSLELELIEGNEVPFKSNADRVIDSKTSSSSGESSSRKAERIGVIKMFRLLSPRSAINLICHSLQNFLSTFADNIYVSWIPLFLADVHGLDFKRMGLFSALPLLGGAIAGVVGGKLNDVWIARTGNRRWARAGVAMIGKGMAASLMFASLLVYDHPYLFCSMLFVIKLFGDWGLASSWGVVSDIGGRVTASVFAFSNTIAGLAIITAPQVFGYVADQYGWRYVFIIVGVVNALCVVSWLLVDSSLPLLKEDEAN
ncbi:MAG: MFS transporter, partial [Planctomycetes bacterium]|nr:MFS transporter [Planctomycetota bacterium]